MDGCTPFSVSFFNIMNGLLQSLHRCKVVLLLCILSCFFFSSKGYSATINIDATNFPDANFRNYLLEQDYGRDGVLSDMEIRNITEIKVNSKHIQNLKGIEFFTALSILYCHWNNLISLDLSQNTNLKELMCGGNQLTSLDVSKNMALTMLDCWNNQLTSLDVSKNTVLKELYCNENRLTLLDISKNTALTRLACNGNRLTLLDVSKNTALTFLACSQNKIKGAAMDALIGSLPYRSSGGDFYVFENGNSNEGNECTKSQVAAAKAKGWTVYYLSNDYWVKYEDDEEATEFAIDRTNFPDDNFRYYLLEQDFGKDGVLTDEEIRKVTELDVSFRQIRSMKGIEFFKALYRLDCFGNKLTSLDVSKNTKLGRLDCYSNQLTSLDLSNNTALRTLYCQNNKELTSLNVSKNTVLTKLVCHYCQLMSLDISKNTAMTELDCHWNQLTSLDISKNTALTELDCSYNELTALNVSKNTALKNLDCYSNQLASIGVTKNIALIELDCGANQLTSLDLSKNTALTVLNCSFNELTSLDVSNNTALTRLSCFSNQLTSLDVSKNTALTNLDCFRNNIKGAAMDALIGSLPYRSSNVEFNVYDNRNNDEGNICTKSQVAAAKAKGWIAYYGNGYKWEEYEGSEDTIVPTIITLPTSITIKVGETVLLTPTIYPEGAETAITGSYGNNGAIYSMYYNNKTQFKICGLKEGTSYQTVYTDNGLSAKCEITVSGYNPRAKGDGTRSNPYNAVGAFLHAASLPYNEPTEESYYIKAKVLDIVEQFGTEYGNCTFYISDDGTIKDEFYVYRTYYLGNRKFAEGDTPLNIGDEVLIYGKLVNYSNGSNRFIPETATNQSYIVSINGKGEQATGQEVNVSSTGYASFFSSQSAYTLPNGLSAQVVTSVANGKLTYKTIADGSVSGIVPKGTAVMLVSDAKRAGTYTLTPSESTASYSGTNLLRGSDDATMTSGDGYHYKLSYGRSGSSLNNVFGWYWGAANGGSFQIDGHKAWLVVPKSSATRGYSIGDEATGITDVEADDADVHYYDLQGRSVSKPQRKGVYIKKGHRVIIK